MEMVNSLLETPKESPASPTFFVMVVISGVEHKGVTWGGGRAKVL